MTSCFFGNVTFINLFFRFFLLGGGGGGGGGRWRRSWEGSTRKGGNLL